MALRNTRLISRALAPLAGFAALLAIQGAASAQQPPPVGDQCENPFVVESLPYIDVDSTMMFRDDVRPFGQCSDGDPAFGQGPDVVYSFQLLDNQSDSVTFYVSPRGHWDCVLYAYVEDCHGLCIAGGNARGPGAPEDFTLEVQPFVRYFIVVDGLAGSAGAYFLSVNRSDDTRCEHIVSPPLGVVGAVESGWPPGHWDADTSPTHQIVGPPPPCQRQYQVPWPRVTPGGAAIWILQADADPRGINFMGMVLPASATAIVHLFGDYTVLPKEGWEEAFVHCRAEWTVTGWQRAFTGPGPGRAESDVEARILVHPFWNPPVWPGQTIIRKTGDENFAGPWNDDDVQLRDVPVWVPQIVDLRFKANSEAWASGFAGGWISRFDMTIECPDDYPTGGGEEEGHEVALRIREASVVERAPVQTGDIVLPEGFTTSFVPVDSLSYPAGLDWSEGHGFGERLYLTRGAGTPPPDFSEDIPPDTSVVMTYLDGSLEEFTSDPLLAPSDLLFDRAGSFDFKLLAAVADSFETGSGAPALGHGAVSAMDASGSRSNLVSGLDSPVALALPSSESWDGNLYVAEVASGEIDRVEPDGSHAVFASTLGLPTDIAFGSGNFGSYLYVAEADTAYPDSVIHAQAGVVTRFDPMGNGFSFATGLHLPMALAWGDPSGPFGDQLYVALSNSFDESGAPQPEAGRIVRIDVSGEITPFASGLEYPVRLAFQPGGDLYVAVAGGIVRISPPSSSGAPEDPSGVPAVPLTLDLAVTPNPFSAGTAIQLAMPRAMRAQIAIFDVSGRLVAHLADERFGPGRHLISWDGSDRRGRALASGIYFVRVLGQEGDGISRRVVRIR